MLKSAPLSIISVSKLQYSTAWEMFSYINHRECLLQHSYQRICTNTPKYYEKKEEEGEMERERIANSHEKIHKICLFIVIFDADP